jgi:Transposase and inactivated derivatives, IS30 family
MRSYGHFTQSDRESLARMRENGMKMREIGEALGKNVSSISRELKRNTNKSSGYNSWDATCKYIHRRKRCRRKSRIAQDAPLLEFIRGSLERYDSPQIIEVMWKKLNPGAKISGSTIYRALKSGMIPGRSAKEHLRRRGAKRYPNRSKFNTITPEHKICERPEFIELRERIGDWEGDCLVSGKKGRFKIFTCVDRASRYVVAQNAHGADAQSVLSAMLNALKGVPIHTLTLDNGAEFAKHKDFARQTGSTVFFADPHSPWQRGSNEQVNGLLRFFFPKSADLALVSDEQIALACDCLNDRPRKCLGWLSPRQVFFSKCCT